jgi:hypothetical protein
LLSIPFLQIASLRHLKKKEKKRKKKKKKEKKRKERKKGAQPSFLERQVAYISLGIPLHF